MNSAAIGVVNWHGFFSLTVFPRLAIAQIFGALVCGSRARMKRRPRISGAVSLAFLVLLVTGCGKPDYMSNPRPVLHTTISSDGQMIATLINAGTEEQRLRVMRLDGSDSWQDVKAPKFTQTIQFALHGKELILTHHLPEFNQDKLVKLDLDNLPSPPFSLYQADRLAFARQVSANDYLIRRCLFRPIKNSMSDCKNRFEHLWVLVRNSEQALHIGDSELAGRYGAPNIVGNGVLFISQRAGVESTEHPLIKAFNFPDGIVPTFPKELLNESTVSLVCDQTASRCLHSFISNLKNTNGGPFVHGLEILHENLKCKLPELTGWIDKMAITPSGSVAVVTYASSAEMPTKIAVVQFDKGQCSATSVKQLNF